MVKLKRLKIEKYRNVKPGTELHFRDSLNVMLGRNGTGKTTLLNLLVQLLSWDFSRLQTEQVSLEYTLHASKAELTVRFRTEVLHESAGAAADVQSLPGEMLNMGLVQSSPRYASNLEIDVLQPDSKPWRVRLDGASLTVTSEGQQPYRIAPEQPLLGQRSLLALVFALSSTSSPKSIQNQGLALMTAAEGLLLFLQRFDESLGYLERVVEKEVISAIKNPQGNGPYVAVSGHASFARSLTVALKSNPDVDVLRIESRDKGQEFLQRLVELLGFESAQVRFQRIARSAGPYKQIDFGNVQFYFARRDGSIINHSLLSYGQKRLLAFYYYLTSYPTCVVADELVNGMHHEWIGACLGDLGARQAFLTSQNPLLLDYLFFESAEEVCSSFVLCRTELHEGREQMVWENMSLDEAEGFFSAYQVAIHHVGELLRLRGLW